jgi:hypothetical protein
VNAAIHAGRHVEIMGNRNDGLAALAHERLEDRENLLRQSAQESGRLSYCPIYGRGLD